MHNVITMHDGMTSMSNLMLVIASHKLLVNTSDNHVAASLQQHQAHYGAANSKQNFVAVKAASLVLAAHVCLLRRCSALTYTLI